MPLLRVAAADRKVFKLLVAETLSEAVNGAIVKLNLNGLDSDFKVCIEDDGPDSGSEVDCDEVFQELLKDACAQKKKLSILIIPVNSLWTRVEQSSSSLLTSMSSSSPSPPSSPPPASPLQSIASPSYCLMEGCSPLPMRDIRLALDPVLKLLGEPTDQQPRNMYKLKQDAVKAAFKFITTHILLSVKDYRRCVAIHYAKSIFYFQNGLYKPIFKQSINGEVCGDGFDDFALKVYNAVSYGKPSDLKIRRGKRSRTVVSEESSDVDDPVVIANPCRNSLDYGCIAYNPPLPVDESPESQEDKRRLLLNRIDENSAEVINLLRLTYSTHRAEIIACKPLKKIVTDFYPRWPHFKSAINLLQHAKALIGKDIFSIFTEELGQKGKQICGFMEALVTAEIGSGQPAKVKRANRISELIKAMDNAYDGSERPPIILSKAAIPTVCKYFNEDFAFILQLVPSGSNDADILEASKCSNGNPILVITGNSIFDEESYPYLVIHNSVIIKCVDLVQSLAACISSFYVFGYSYTNEVKCTLEFIQRFLLNINPEKGSKLTKRSTGNVSAKVVNLSNELQAFNSPWALGF